MYIKYNKRIIFTISAVLLAILALFFNNYPEFEGLSYEKSENNVIKAFINNDDAFIRAADFCQTLYIM